MTLTPEISLHRIAYVHPVPPGKYGGGEVVTLQLIGGLNHERYRPYGVVAGPGEFEQALRARRAMVEVFPLLQAAAMARRGVVRFGIFLGRNILAAPALARWIRQNSIDLLHTGTRGGHIAGLLAGRLAGVPVIMHVHALFQRPAFYTLLARNSAHAIVVPSSTTRDWLLRSRWGTAVQPKIRLVPNPVDDSFFHASTAVDAARARLGLNGCYPVLALVAALEEWKGQADMVRAMPQVLRRFPGARLLLIGAEIQLGSFLPELRRLIGELRLEPHVQLLGYREDVPDLLAASDIAVLASWRDAYPAAVGEAMASAKPVIATRSGGSVDLVRHGETGLLVEPRSPAALADAVITLAEDRERMRYMGARGRDVITSRGAPGAFVAQIESLYAEALLARA